MPRPIVVGGVNGSGKSTLTQSLRFNNVRVIDPDAIAKSLSQEDDDSARATAGREAIRLRKFYLNNGDSFALETTLSGKDITRLMRKARASGYRVELHYVSLIDAQQSVDRVATRVAKGGHDIPERDIRRRFPRSRANFVDAALLADHVVVYDNSGLDSPFEPVLLAQATGFEMHALAPEWVVESVKEIRNKPNQEGTAKWK